MINDEDTKGSKGSIFQIIVPIFAIKIQRSRQKIVHDNQTADKIITT